MKKTFQSTHVPMGRVSVSVLSSKKPLTLKMSSKRTGEVKQAEKMTMEVKLAGDTNVSRRVMIAMPGCSVVSFDMMDVGASARFSLPANLSGPISIWTCKTEQNLAVDDMHPNNRKMGRKLTTTGRVNPVSDGLLVSGKPKYATLNIVAK